MSTGPEVQSQQPANPTPDPDHPPSLQTETIFLQLEHITVNLGKRTVLLDVNAQFPPGAIGLLGPNGAGKSTLLKTLMGFLPPHSGTARIFGYDPSRQGAEVRQVLGYMPEEDTYIPGMSAVEFVSYCGRLCGLPAKDAILRAHQSLHYCGLGEARYRKIDTYSTGMRQRIKLAQALVHDPRLMLLDEPTNGLDPDGRKAMLELIQDITHNKGISVILSSHLLPDVESVCDQVMVLFQGKVTAAGRIQDLKKMARIAYEVKLKGDANRFIDTLSSMGGQAEPKRDGLLRVTIEGNPFDTQTIFRAAEQAQVQLRHLSREETSLQEIFSQAIHPNA